MKKTIQLKESIYEICSEYPEVKDLLAQLGFRDITKPEVLHTIGKLMTIPQGASMRGIDLSKVILELRANGFEIGEAEFSKNIGGSDEGLTSADAPTGAVPDVSTRDEDRRAALLKEYVDRLSRGDSLDAVRKDFVAHFQNVDAAEIANAEQALISSGTPVAEVQRLCDVHSALFHGATREEQIANAEKAVQASAESAGKTAANPSLSQISGHPMNLFTAENKVISDLISEVRQCAASENEQNTLSEKLNAFHAVTEHYAKKGDLLYPLLRSKYGVSGPADVMWGVDDEIKNELKILTGAQNTLPHFWKRLDTLLTRAEEMIFKENQILFPLCTQNFTEEDWMRIYYELPAYDNILPGERPVWKAAEARREELKNNHTKEPVPTSDGSDLIPLGSGHMTASQIEAVLDTIPIELSFVDDGDINRYFNAGPGKKLFKRPDEAVDREVFSCHPPKYATMARQIINNLKTGARDSVDVWLNKGGEPVLVRYMAVRDKNGKYVGTLECVQEMGFAKEHFKRSMK
jgi:DUF438 domain-containing protein